MRLNEHATKNLLAISLYTAVNVIGMVQMARLDPASARLQAVIRGIKFGAPLAALAVLGLSLMPEDNPFTDFTRSAAKVVVHPLGLCLVGLAAYHTLSPTLYTAHLARQTDNLSKWAVLGGFTTVKLAALWTCAIKSSIERD